MTASAVPAPLTGLAARLPRARSLGVELAVIAGHVLLYPTGIAAEAAAPAASRAGAHPDGAPPAGPSAPAPVLLLHGFVDNRSVFTVLRRSLLRHGWPRVHAFNYSPFTCDARRAAAVLGAYVEQLSAECGGARIDVVGHSLGGLVARYYVQRLGGDERVRTLVTLGTPHSGTRAVPLMSAHPVVRQMRPGSALLTELAGPAPGCRTRFTAFWSDMDQAVSPVENARLDHPDLAADNVAVRGVGHLTLPVHGAVTAAVRRALLGGDGLASGADAA
ncbi:alpha/beta fold hydrolase [Streptomyces capparidis]